MSLPRLSRSQPLLSWEIEAATPAQVDTDLYWTLLEMQRISDHIDALRRRRSYDAQRTVEINREIAGLNEQWESLSDHCDALDAEYRKRMWLRAYLVTSSDGHIHSGPYCTTFQARTRATLLPQASGMTREEIIDAVGEKGCTVCFPGAPVKPTTLRDPLTAQEQDAKAAEKAAKDAEKAAKGITTPEGAPLYTARWSYIQGCLQDEDIVKTEIAANRRALEALYDLGWYGLGNTDRSAWAETVRRMVHALSAKRQQGIKEITIELVGKTNKKLARDGADTRLDVDEVIRWVLPL